MTSQRKFYLVGICSSVQKGPKRNKEYDSRDYYYAKCPLHELIHHVWLPIWLNKLIARHWTIYTKKLLADMMIPWECFTTLNFQPCWHRCPLSIYIIYFDEFMSTCLICYNLILYATRNKLTSNPWTLILLYIAKTHDPFYRPCKLGLASGHAFLGSNIKQLNFLPNYWRNIPL